MNIAFVSYETPFAPCGGIAAVMARLPARVRAVAHRETVVVTPFHYSIDKMVTLGHSHEGSFGVPFEGRTVVFHIQRHDVDKLPFFFLLPEDRRFFAGRRHPYDVPADDLLRDALLFGAALPRALAVIDPGKRWTMFLQDWEAATAVLATADFPGQVRALVTLHNSYDAPVSDERLAAAGINPQSCPGETVLQRALALTELPIFTVSEQFARDLTEDTLQSQVMAPHLQMILKPRLRGIDNGPFVDVAVPAAALASAASGQLTPLAEWKSAQRQTFVSALAELKRSPDKPLFGDLQRFVRDDAPWFVMAGRDDSRQKGYDVAARAAALFLEANGRGRFLFFPIPGDEGKEGLEFLRLLAERFPASVLAFPFLFREGFLAALRGATYGIMPSLYEPFGMGNEFYLNGTVGIGRATGGIIQQIVPWREAASCGESVLRRASRCHSPETPPTGLLFREADGLATELDDWRGINAAAYSQTGCQTDRVTERSRFPLYQSMADALRQALHDASNLACDHPESYFRLLIDGIAHIQRTFSWDRAAQDYLRHLG